MEEVNETVDINVQESVEQLIEEMDARIHNQLNEAKISDPAIQCISREATQIRRLIQDSRDRSMVELIKLIEICLYRILFCGPQKQRHGLRLISAALVAIKHHQKQSDYLFDENRIADAALTLWSWLDRSSYNS